MTLVPLNGWKEKNEENLKKLKMLKTILDLKSMFYVEIETHDLLIDFYLNQKKTTNTPLTKFHVYFSKHSCVHLSVRYSD